MIEQALSEHRTLMLRFAIGACHVPSEDAEDVVQTAALRAWAYRTSFIGQSTVQTWLLSIVKRCAIDYFFNRERETTLSTALCCRGRSVVWPDDPVLCLTPEEQTFAESVTAETLRPSRQTRRKMQRIREKLEVAREPRPKA